MTFLFALAAATGLFAAFGVVLLIVGLRVSRTVGAIGGPFARGSTLGKVSFGLLWVLIACAAFGLLRV